MEEAKTIYVGIRTEDKSAWERRTALTPASIKKILQSNASNKECQIKFVVSPSMRRAFENSQYREAGAEISEDLSKCSLIIGVKEVPQGKYQENTTYMIFSHTIKAQPAQMPLLDEVLQKKVRLLDYEKITDEKGVRLIAFGRYAGIAGALDAFGGIGKFLLHKGWSTPFLKIPQSYTYLSIDAAYKHLKDLSDFYSQPGKQLVPDELCPMVFAITGKGRCAMGTYEVLEKLPIKLVEPDQLAELHKNKDDEKHKHQIYVTFVEEEHQVRPKDPNHTMTRPDYYQNPEKYEPIFYEKYFPYISVIFNNIYWEEKYSRLLSNQQLKEYFEKNPNNNFIGVCDVTCDFKGSIECLSQFTTPDSPFWTYNPLTEEVRDGPTYTPGSIFYQSLDFLPCELAEDASNHFSNILEDWIVNIAQNDINLPLEEQHKTLLPQIQRAQITWNGKLTPNFEYIDELRKQNGV